MRLHEVCRTSTELYLVGDLIVGYELYDVIRHYGKLPEPIVRLLVSQLLTALEHLHDLGVVRALAQGRPTFRERRALHALARGWRRDTTCLQWAGAVTPPAFYGLAP